MFGKALAHELQRDSYYLMHGFHSCPLAPSNNSEVQNAIKKLNIQSIQDIASLCPHLDSTGVTRMKGLEQRGFRFRFGIVQNLRFQGFLQIYGYCLSCASLVVEKRVLVLTSLTLNTSDAVSSIECGNFRRLKYTAYDALSVSSIS